MIRPSAFLLVLLAASALADLDAADWTTYRHDNRRSGATADQLTFPLKALWTHEGGAPREAWSGPAKWDAYSGNAGLQSMRNFDPCYFVTVADGLLYYGSSHDNAVHALDVKSGAERWVFFAEAPVRLPPTVADGVAFAGSDDGFLYALNARDGSLLWKDHGAPEPRRIPSNAGLLSLWPVRTAPLLAGDSLYYTASLTPWESSWLLAVDPKSGARRFAQELSGVTLQGALLASTQTVTDPESGAVTVTPNLIAPQGRSSPLLFDARTGQPAGTIGHAGGVFCLVTEDDQLIAGPNSQKPSDQQLLLTDSEGKKIATFNDTSRAVLVGGVAYLHTRGSLQALRYDGTAAALWSTPTSIPSELILSANAVLIGLADSLAAYARENGALLWQATVPGRVHGLAIADGVLFASTSLGAIHAFGP